MHAVDLASLSFLNDPYPAYRRLLADAPLYQSPDDGAWFVSRHADVAGLLRHPGISASYSSRLLARLDEDARRDTRALSELLSRMSLFRDPPAQVRLHRAFRQALTPELVAALEPQVADLAERLIEDVQDREFDVMRELAYPLPSAIVAGLLGVPAADVPQFREWTQQFARLVGVPTGAEEVGRIQRALEGAVEYFRGLLAEPPPTGGRPSWRGVLRRELQAAVERDPDLSEADLPAGCVLLVFAGHETIAAAIGNTLVTLLAAPAVMSAVRHSPGLLDAAVEECLRYESPIQRTGRIALEEIPVEGGRVPAGASLKLLLGAANRDPRVFDDPDRFDPARARRPHLGFGAGGHRCPGAALGLLETRAAVAALLRRFGGIDLATAPQWECNLTLRRVRELRLSVVRERRFG